MRKSPRRSFYARHLSATIPALVSLTLFTGFFGTFLLLALELLGFSVSTFARRHPGTVLWWAATMTVTTVIYAVDEAKKSWKARKDELRG